MQDNNTSACSNISCPINYDCQRFKNFLESKYSFCEEFAHNGNLTCDLHTNEDINTQTDTQPVKAYHPALF